MNGISLLSLPYSESLRILQNTGKVVQLIVSQIYLRRVSRTLQEIVENEKEEKVPETPVKDVTPKKEVKPKNNLITTPSKSLPNLVNSKNVSLPKVIFLELLKF